MTTPAMPSEGPNGPNKRIKITDLYFHMESGKYFYIPTRTDFKPGAINRQVLPVAISSLKLTPIMNGDGSPHHVPLTSKRPRMAATEYIAKYQAVEQLTWYPGEADTIEGRLLLEGGWVPKPKARVFNLYIPPRIKLGDPDDIGPWLNLLAKVYPEEMTHIISWLAHRVQRPHEKINHAIVLGGDFGIGKDSILAPAVKAVGEWNVAEASPKDIMDTYNPYMRSVILRISEARDLGDTSRYDFYESMKAVEAAPPDVVTVNMKYIPHHPLPNVTAVVYTTNHKSDGIYLPAGDRRHFVAWSEAHQDQDGLTPEYFKALYTWYENGGYENVAALLATWDLSNFDPKAPPEKTLAYWDIVNANRAPEDAELADALDALDNPPAVTLDDLIAGALTEEFEQYLKDRRNRRKIPHRLEQAGYVRTDNPTAITDRLWVVHQRRSAVYALKTLSIRERIEAAETLCRKRRGPRVVKVPMRKASQ